MIIFDIYYKFEYKTKKMLNELKPKSFVQSATKCQTNFNNYHNYNKMICKRYGIYKVKAKAQITNKVFDEFFFQTKCKSNINPNSPNLNSNIFSEANSYIKNIQNLNLNSTTNCIKSKNEKKIQFKHYIDKKNNVIPFNDFSKNHLRLTNNTTDINLTEEKENIGNSISNIKNEGNNVFFNDFDDNFKVNKPNCIENLDTIRKTMQGLRHNYKNSSQNKNFNKINKSFYDNYIKRLQLRKSVDNKKCNKLNKKINNISNNNIIQRNKNVNIIVKNNTASLIHSTKYMNNKNKINNTNKKSPNSGEISTILKKIVPSKKINSLGPKNFLKNKMKYININHRNYQKIISSNTKPETKSRNSKSVLKNTIITKYNKCNNNIKKAYKRNSKKVKSMKSMNNINSENLVLTKRKNLENTILKKTMMKNISNNDFLSLIVNFEKKLDSSIKFEDDITDKEEEELENTPRINKLEMYFNEAKKILNDKNRISYKDVKSKIENEFIFKNEISVDEEISKETIKVPVFKEINLINNLDGNEDNKLYQVFFRVLNENEKYFIEFLDIKSLINLSSISKQFHKNYRHIFYSKISKKILIGINYINFNIKEGSNDIRLNINKSSFIENIIHSLIKMKDKTELQKLYESFANKKSQYDDLIIRDLSRTFPYDIHFKKDSECYSKLYRLLTRYSNYNKNIGYAQGLNFIFAKSLYLFQTEEEVFIFVDGLINMFKLDNFMSEENANLSKHIENYSKILDKYIPKLKKFLRKKLLTHEFFSTGWILTLLSNAMNIKNLIIVWSFMIIFGWKFFYSFVIEILLFYENLILNTHENNLSLKMKNLLKEEEFKKDIWKIVHNTLCFMQKNITL